MDSTLAMFRAKSDELRLFGVCFFEDAFFMCYCVRLGAQRFRKRWTPEMADMENIV